MLSHCYHRSLYKAESHGNIVTPACCPQGLCGIIHSLPHISLAEICPGNKAHSTYEPAPVGMFQYMLEILNGLVPVFPCPVHKWKRGTWLADAETVSYLTENSQWFLYKFDGNIIFPVKHMCHTKRPLSMSNKVAVAGFLSCFPCLSSIDEWLIYIAAYTLISPA